MVLQQRRLGGVGWLVTPMVLWYMRTPTNKKQYNDIWWCLMEATTETIHEWINHFHEKVVDWNYFKPDVWIGPALFCALH